MKKIISVLLVLTVMLSFAACSKKADSTPEDAAPQTTQAPDENTDATPANNLLAEFKSIMAAGDKTTAEDIATALSEKLEVNAAVMAVEEGYLNGFDNEIKGFKEGTMFGPVIGAIPFVGYVFVLEDGADADAFMQTLKDNANLSWNICTQADEMVCEAEGNTIFFVMSPLSFEEE